MLFVFLINVNLLGARMQAKSSKSDENPTLVQDKQIFQAVVNEGSHVVKLPPEDVLSLYEAMTKQVRPFNDNDIKIKSCDDEPQRTLIVEAVLCQCKTSITERLFTSY